jgi:hypothetical protein
MSTGRGGEIIIFFNINNDKHGLRGRVQAFIDEAGPDYLVQFVGTAAKHHSRACCVLDEEDGILRQRHTNAFPTDNPTNCRSSLLEEANTPMSCWFMPNKHMPWDVCFNSGNPMRRSIPVIIKDVKKPAKSESKADR